MAYRQRQDDGSGTMIAVIVIGSGALAIGGALWIGFRMVELLYPAVRPGFAESLVTLYRWGSATVWRTGQPLPSPAAWHWVAAVVAALTFVIGWAVIGLVWHGLHGGGRTAREDPLGTPPPRPRNY